MKVLISAALQRAFQENHKNLNYSLSFLLNSMDLDTCSECLKLVEEFRLAGDRVEVVIDEDNVKNIKSIFEITENSLIEQLLWVSILFPEI